MKKFILFTSLIAMAGQAIAQTNIAALLVASNSSNNTTASVVILNSSTAAQASPTTYAINGTTGTDALRFSGSATSTGYLSNNDSRTLVAFTGANTTSTAGNVNTVLARGVGTIDNSGTYALATTYTGATSNQARSATTVDNTNYFIADQGGIYTNSTTTPSPAGNYRSIKSFGGTVYISSASATLIQVGTVSAPSGGTVTGLPGLATNANLQDFYLIQSGTNGTTYDVLYVLSATSNTAGTISKYSLVGGTWTANGSYTTTFGGFGLQAQNNGTGGAYLYASTGSGALAANNVLRLTDATGYNTPISITTANNVILYTAPAGTTVKGVALAPQVAVLAISLQDIAAANTGAANVVNWQTGAEAAGDYFELYRSADGKTFTKLATIAPTGANSHYTYTDNAPNTTTSYYRLKMLDKTGTGTYSKVVTASMENQKAAGFAVVPNPVTNGRLSIQTQGAVSGTYELLLYNSAGQVAVQQAVQTETEHTISISLPAALQNGAYYVVLTNGINKYSQRIVVAD